MDSTNMESAAMCRICLAEDVRMYLIAKTRLQEMYEKITVMPFVTEDCRPLLVCYICHARLKNCYQLKMNCLQTEELFTQMSSNMIKQGKLKPISRLKLATTAIVHITITNEVLDDTADGVKVEIPEESSVAVKEENVEDEKHDNLEEEITEIDHMDIHSTDSEDNVPLKIIKTKSERKIKKNKKLKVRNKDSSDIKIRTMEQHKKPTYKYCIVPKCKNTIRNAPDKVFFLVPRGIHVRREWCNIMKRDMVAPLSCLYCCEDHFNVEEDTDNYMEYKIMHLQEKQKTTLRLKKAQKLDAHEIILTKEEQLANLLARAKTMNYTLSPYKCDLCYKGFVDSNAYENHTIKHDKRSGVHSCDICHLRYRSSQQLRTHAVTAHSRLFRCNTCGHTSHTANQARVHEKWHSGYMYECQLCGHKFRKPTSYLSHLRKRHPTEHVCDVCGESFVGKHGLLMHKSKTHRHDTNLTENLEEPTTDRFCSECDILFYNKDAWKRHILCSVKHALSNETSTSCTICGWGGGRDALSRHLREHARALRVTRVPRARDARATDKLHCHCAQCGANFGNRQKLQAHINRMHLGRKYNKHIVCEICGKHCTSNATLKYHQRTHTGERPYTCSTCTKQFTDSNQLRIHTRTHTGEKPYECAVCGKRFTQKPALNRHYRVHTGDKPYICQYCSRTFSQSNSLKLHVRTVHLKLPANNKKKVQNSLQDTNEKTDQKIQIGQEVVP